MGYSRLLEKKNNGSDLREPSLHSRKLKAHSSRARCVPLQYLSSATGGVKQALNLNKALNKNLIVVSTPLQEKENISGKALNSLNKAQTDQVSQLESGMFYELSNRKRMECEKYQDCSWFQSSPMKSKCSSKLSLAETFDSFIETNEFDLPMHYANSQTSPWGDEYLEVFTDDIPPEDNYKLGEKSKNYLTDENFFSNYKKDEENGFDSFNLSFSLKKTGSTDSMKNISSTNPFEVIPISFKERLNNSNYGLMKLDKVKSEIKKEVEFYSQESNSYLMDSDDSDLNIGREEEVEEMNLTEDLQINNEKEKVNLGQIKCEVPTVKILSDYDKDESNKFDENDFKAVSSTVKAEHGIDNHHTSGGKFDLNLDIAKLNFEQSLNVVTPDLDFMDLVDFINEEMNQENGNLASSNSLPDNNIMQETDSKQIIVSNENQNNTENVQHSEASHPSSSVQDLSFVNTEMSTNLKNNTVDFNEVFNSGVSIAERIKTNAKRRTRKNLKEFIDSEDEGSSSLDDDEDYNYRENMAKRRCAPVKKRRKSSILESSGCGKRLKDESSSYREKRDKNNEASRRSRQNRKAREQHMYETLKEEERRNIKLKAEADALEKQVTSLRQLLLHTVLHKGGTT